MKGRDYLSRVRASARRMGELIDDLLELSKVGRAEIVRIPVDLSSLARGIAAELGQREPGRPVEITIADTPVALADPRLLRVVLENLLGNAWKFTGRVQAPRIGFRAEESSGETRYVVEDNGSGFNMEYAARLFQPFQRFHSDADFAGTGIGLATVQRIVDRHGGRVWARSAPGEGAAFFFVLPPVESVARG
jgi:light-regulated signal transduction histidine kinase (bacteriophytochrome)